MRRGGRLVGACMLCALAGCSGAGADLGTAQPSQPAREPTSTTIQATAQDDTLVEGSVSGRLPIENASECAELGFPITVHLTDAFSPDTLVSETATPASSSACVHVQTLAAPVDAWARVVYVTICGGGGDANLCGAQATRLCSVDVLLGWAGDRGPVAPVRDEIFGFEYAVPHPNTAAQKALYRSALREVEALVTESKIVLAKHSDGSRHCAGENYDEIDANLAASLPLHERIAGILSGG